MTTTTEKLEAIKSALRSSMELSEKATAGKWSIRKEYFDRDEPSNYAAYDVFPHTEGRKRPKDRIGHWSALATCDDYDPNNRNNAAFIAHARTMLPVAARALLTAIEALQKECAKFSFPDEDRPVCWEALEAICREFEGVA